MASRDFHKDYSNLADVSGELQVWEWIIKREVLWRKHRTEILGRFFFPLRSLLYISL